MHGHGPKPHLCYFKGCDRAKEDNGFPRRWNLFDHMKRVHDYSGTEPSNKSSSPSPSSGSPEPYVDQAKKKRTPSPTIEGAAKKAKITASGHGTDLNGTPQNQVYLEDFSMVPDCQSQSLNQIWYDQIAQVQARLQSLDPMDPRQLDQYQADTAILHNIGQNIQLRRQAQLPF